MSSIINFNKIRRSVTHTHTPSPYRTDFLHRTFPLNQTCRERSSFRFRLISSPHPTFHKGPSTNAATQSVAMIYRSPRGMLQLPYWIFRIYLFIRFAARSQDSPRSVNIKNSIHDFNCFPPSLNPALCAPNVAQHPDRSKHTPAAVRPFGSKAG